jgi:hypothetical protein
VSADGGADDTVDAIGRGRLKRKLSAPPLQKRNKLIRNRPDSRHLTAQPIFEQGRIGDGSFSKTGQGANFGAVPFGGPSRQDRRKARRDHDGELLCDLLDEHGIDLAGGSRKPSQVAEERQQHRETEPVGVVLGNNERQIRRRQRRSLQGQSFIYGIQLWGRRLPRM